MSQCQNPKNSHETHLRAALDHAQRLAEPRAEKAFTPAWSAQAHHVGDMTVLALALALRD
jgi:hypothetical protein